MPRPPAPERLVPPHPLAARTLGYVRVVPDPAGGRARRVLFSAKGQRLLSALGRASAQAEAELGGALGARRLAALRAALEATLRHLPAHERT